MYGLSLVASMESLKGHERPLNPPRRQPSESAKNRALRMRAGAVAAMILVVPVLDTLL